MHTEARRESKASFSNGQSFKMAGLWKRSQGLHRFTKPNYRHRIFILTEQALSYYGGTMDRIGSLKGRISLDSIRAVELVDHSAFGLDHTLQIIHHTKKNGIVTLYVTARDKEECDDWMVALRQVCCYNQDMLMHFHSGSYIGSKWTCCQKRSRQTLGCEPTYFLLTKSSSRYAESKRIETVTKLNRKSFVLDLNNQLDQSESDSLVQDMGFNEEDVPMITSNQTSVSCQNIHHLADKRFPSNFSVTQDMQITPLMAQSCYSIDCSLDPTTHRRPSLFNPSDRGHRTPPERFASIDNGCNRHQVAPLPDPETPVFDTFPRKRKSLMSTSTCNSNSNHRSSSPLVTATKCYILQGRSPLNSSSREPSVEKDCVVIPARKASIEPRISDTNPELIHV